MLPQLVELLRSFVYLIPALVFHEFAHGWVAYKLGDRTAQSMGRLSLNPLKHIDPIGTIAMPLVLFLSTGGRFVFGAAKPVPVNFAALRNPRRDMVLVGLAGPLANFLFAFVLVLVWKFLPSSEFLGFRFENFIFVNVFLGAFNLVPIPPLDGSRVVMGLLPYAQARSYAMLEPFGFIIVLALLWVGLLDAVVWPFVQLVLSLLMIFH